jgi:hypothetical protein
MSDYTFWINWFRSNAPKPSSVPQASSRGAPGFDSERYRRVLNGGTARATVQNLGLVKSLSPAERMINWLKTQPAEVVDAAAANLNWDRAEEVVLWLLAQPTTDAATAVKLFMRAEPAFYVDSKGQDPSYEAEEFVEKVVLTFAANWTANRYARGGVGYDPREVSPYGSSDIFFINELNEDIAKYAANGSYPLPQLPGLAGPFNGPKPKELEVYLKARGRSELFFVRYLYAGLGTWITDDDISEADFDGWMRQNGLIAE